MTAPPPPPVSKKSVLIIDGNDQDRSHYADGLRDHCPDYAIIEVASGEMGLSACESQRIDCVILELDLPDMSGFEILIKLVPVARRPEIPVIVLTRLPNPDILVLAVKNGAFEGLIKGRTSGERLHDVVIRAMAKIVSHGKDRYRNLQQADDEMAL
ncbi:hypothetical protein W02_31670 [Nitrospira sp. KM1]|uniref:response regulator n=1 Tax=Nitrospira sp. KM1 TaxID=1936990 RepID=UPI0013A749E9|nr:response regulator [Nitrospira sp. KM1]BCA56027.1 hypothetical protein W02_31670 [Nitrospira sp. KM1]